MGIEALIVETAEMAPAAELELAVKTWVALLRIPLELNFCAQQQRIVDAKIHTVPVAKLRVASAGAGGIAVEDCLDQGQIVSHVCTEARADSCQRRRRTAARHIRGKDAGPPE